MNEQLYQLDIVDAPSLANDKFVTAGLITGRGVFLNRNVQPQLGH